MLTKTKLPLLITLILCIELLIYLWAAWTATFDASNFFAIKSEFIFAKCARNSGRVSSTIILITLLNIGYYGLKEIYWDDRKKNSLRILITLFTINHLVHFIFVILNFKSISKPFLISDNIHGFITFVFIVIMPVILWYYKRLNRLLYCAIILHLFNVSYFMSKTFLGKVKPDHPAYHNQFGIFALTTACLYVLYRVFRENKTGMPDNGITDC